MNEPAMNPQRRLSRRDLLRGAGVSLALPWLEALPRAGAAEAAGAGAPMRAIFISNNLGVLPKPFFPETTGRDYVLSPSLERLAAHRGDFTVISGLSHPNVRGGHSTENCFLTAARNPTASGFRNTISLDQFAAERIGHHTRFATLNLGVNIDKANRSLAWTRDGCLIPPEDRPSRLFEKLFVTGSPAEVAARRRQLRERESILGRRVADFVNFVDLAPTVLEFFGLTDTDPGPTKAFVSAAGQLDRFWKLCFGLRPAEELYDVEQDPDCIKNLAGDPAHAAVRARLAERLMTMLREQQDPRVLGKGDAFDEYPAPPDARKPWSKADAPDRDRDLVVQHAAHDTCS